MPRLAALVMSAAALSGCAKPTDRATFAVQRETMIGSPAAFRHHVLKCVGQLGRDPGRAAELIRLANAPADRGVEIVCERYMAAIRDGRLSHDDYVGLVNRDYTPQRIRILQGAGPS